MWKVLKELVFGRTCNRCGNGYRSDFCPCWQKRLYESQRFDSRSARGVYHPRVV